MQIKTEAMAASTEDFWYDLMDGGYLKPAEMLEDERDVERVLSAIQTLVEFRETCEEQIEGFLR